MKELNRIWHCSPSVRAFLLLTASLSVAVPAPPTGSSPAGQSLPGVAGHTTGPSVVRPPSPGRPTVGITPLTNTTGYWSASGYHGPVQPGSGNNFPGGGGIYRPGNGGHGGNHGSGNGGRGNRGGLPWTSYLAPYYYPLLDTGDSADVQYGQYGMPPGADNGSSQDAVMLGNQIGEQLNDLSAQVSDLRRAQEQGAKGGTPQNNAVPANSDSDAPPAVPVTLVLRNGQQLKVQNYAIVDGSFWDLGNGVTKKISLDDIDLAASAKATEDAGGEFPVVPDGAGEGR